MQLNICKELFWKKIDLNDFIRNSLKFETKYILSEIIE